MEKNGTEMITANIQGDRKVTQPIPDTCSICQKKKTTTLKSENRKQSYIKCWKFDEIR
jgi:hypothetical protein